MLASVLLTSNALPPLPSAVGVAIVDAVLMIVPAPSTVLFNSLFSVRMAAVTRINKNVVPL